MNETTELYKELKEEKREKKLSNLEHSTKAVEASGIPFQRKNEFHIIIEGYDFWPSTGLFINRKTQKRDRGVYRLLKILKEKQ